MSPPRGKPFESGPDSRRHDGRAIKLGPRLRRMLRDSGQVDKIAKAVVAGIETGWLPLKVPDIGKSNGGGFELKFPEWIQLLSLAGIVDESVSGMDAVVADDVRALSDAELNDVIQHGRELLRKPDHAYTEAELTAMIEGRDN